MAVQSPWAEDGSSGTAFSFSVAIAPCGAEESAPDAVTTAAPVDAPVSEQAVALEPHLRVLVADDQQTNRRLLRRAFSNFFGEGWEVTEASTAEEALDLAGESDYDIVARSKLELQHVAG